MVSAGRGLHRVLFVPVCWAGRCSPQKRRGLLCGVEEKGTVRSVCCPCYIQAASSFLAPIPPLVYTSKIYIYFLASYRMYYSSTSRAQFLVWITFSPRSWIVLFARIEYAPPLKTLLIEQKHPHTTSLFDAKINDPEENSLQACVLVSLRPGGPDSFDE